jgi:hypothetical protein
MLRILEIYPIPAVQAKNISSIASNSRNVNINFDKFNKTNYYQLKIVDNKKVVIYSVDMQKYLSTL